MIVLARDDFTCQQCGLREPAIMQIDHITPRCVDKSKINELNNLRTLCPNCHCKKTY